MAAAPRVAPRFVPTLTEVVHASARVGPLQHQPAPAPAAAPDADALLVWVQAEVGDVLQRNLHDLVANALVEQVDVVADRLRQEIEPLVRRAVAQALASELASRDAGESG